MNNKTEEKAIKSATKPTLVPVLRFPEFQDAGGWKIRQLGELLLGKPEYGVNAPAVPYSERLPTYLRITDISEEGIFLSETKVSVDIVATEDNYLNEGDVVLARTGASVGKSYKYRKEDGRLVFAGFLIRIKPDPKNLNSTFLFNFLSTNMYWDWVRITSARSGQPGINGSEYALLPIPVPPPDEISGDLYEQQKIADCLASLDKIIAAQTQKIDALKAHKKGLIQQLFPAEGETLPELRFPEFRDAGEWKTAPMVSLLARNPEYGVNAPAVPYSIELPTYLRITDIDDDGHFLTESKVSVDIVATDDNYLEPGDIVLARTGASVGKSYRYRTEDGRLVFAGFLIRIKPETKKVNPIFLANFLTTQQYWRWVGVTSARSGQPGINGTEYSSLPVPVPSSASENNGLLEQKRIADCLTSLDELITAQAQKLDALRAHKKGLMQQLFPVLDEVKE